MFKSARVATFSLFANARDAKRVFNEADLYGNHRRVCACHWSGGKNAGIDLPMHADAPKQIEVVWAYICCGC